VARPKPSNVVRLPVRVRRTHAERTAETRAKVIAAVVDSIAELGFQRTTALVIAQRAGVTWGAVQHHFGGKDGLMLAVLEDSFRRFAERLEDVSADGTGVRERVSLFVDRAWDHFRSRHFRSTFEILLNDLGRDESTGTGDWRGRMTVAWDGVWSGVFADVRMARAKRLMLQHYAIATLSGLAATVMIGSSDHAQLRNELALLKDTLTRSLTAAE